MKCLVAQSFDAMQSVKLSNQGVSRTEVSSLANKIFYLIKTYQPELLKVTMPKLESINTI